MIKAVTDRREHPAIPRSSPPLGRAYPGFLLARGRSADHRGSPYCQMCECRSPQGGAESFVPFVSVAPFVCSVPSLRLAVLAGVRAGEQVLLDGEMAEAVAAFHHLHDAAPDDRVGIERFKTMERKLYFGIMTPDKLIGNFNAITGGITMAATARMTRRPGRNASTVPVRNGKPPATARRSREIPTARSRWSAAIHYAPRRPLRSRLCLTLPATP